MISNFFQMFLKRARSPERTPAWFDHCPLDHGLRGAEWTFLPGERESRVDRQRLESAASCTALPMQRVEGAALPWSFISSYIVV